MDIQTLLGDDADDLLGHQSTAIPAADLHLPGPDFIDEVVSATDRSPYTTATGMPARSRAETALWLPGLGDVMIRSGASAATDSATGLRKLPTRGRSRTSEG